MGSAGEFSEERWEILAIEALARHEWGPKGGIDIAPGSGERESWDDPVIQRRFREALVRLNPTIPSEYLQQAAADILSAKSQDAITENFRIHQWLVDGYRGVSYIDADGTEQTPTIRLVSDQPHENDWLVVNQVIVRSGEYQRRFDVVLYCNGLPVAVIELKAAGAAKGVPAAHNQLQTYLRELPLAFRFCLLVVATDGATALYGTPFTPLNHFAPWNVDDDGARVEIGAYVDDEHLGTGLEYVIDGVFNQERFLQLLRYYTAFDEGAHGLEKRIAKPHQYFAVTKAVASTIEAVQSNGKAGVVWHTQGSGKSMEMELYANRVLRRSELANPTIVVVTDRTELDGQLYETFKQSRLLPENPVIVRRRSELRDQLAERRSGGICSPRSQKFGRTEAERHTGADHPLLTDRRNVIVIVDEAHRSHYDDLDGYARHIHDALPHATFIAFTGTPISFADRDTRATFGDYIDIYDLSRAVADGATVPVYFEPRLIKIGFAEDLTDEDIDRAADEAAVGVDLADRDRIERSVAVLNAVYGAPARLKALAADIVEHWANRRKRMAPFIDGPGKAMIVGGTRRICADLYEQIVALRPDWHDKADDKGRVKVVYSGDASDPAPIQTHVRRESLNKTIKERLRNVDDELEIVIVKDMMLTGYDSPPLHTLYLDRPLKGALLMQTLARVNRTFRGKQDGLLVAYAPLADNLTKALAEYTATDVAERPVGRDVTEAVALTRKLVSDLAGLCAGFDWKTRLTADSSSWIKAAMATTNYIRSPDTPGNDAENPEDRLANRFRILSGQLGRAWAISSGSRTLTDLRADVSFYEQVRVLMAKFDAQERQSRGEPVPEDVERLLRQLVAESTAAGGIVDIYDAAGLPRPTLADLDADTISAAVASPTPHLAIEALRDLLTAESRRATRHNVVRQRAFSERINELMLRYTNQQLTSAEVIAELVELAREVIAEGDRGLEFEPPLNEDELAFYDAVSQNESAVEIQGTDVLARIARELVEVMRRDVKTDWTVRDDVRAKLRSSVKRLLVKYRYPPDRQPEAIQLVIEQMESMAPRYAEASARPDAGALP